MRLDVFSFDSRPRDLFRGEDLAIITATGAYHVRSINLSSLESDTILDFQHGDSIVFGDRVSLVSKAPTALLVGPIS